jgi:hypothetical protein
MHSLDQKKSALLLLLVLFLSACGEKKSGSTGAEFNPASEYNIPSPNLNISQNGLTLTLTWEASDESLISYYEVEKYVGTEYEFLAKHAGTEFEDIVLTAGTHAYRVRAVYEKSDTQIFYSAYSNETQTTITPEITIQSDGSYLAPSGVGITPDSTAIVTLSLNFESQETITCTIQRTGSGIDFNFVVPFINGTLPGGTPTFETILNPGQTSINITLAYIYDGVPELVSKISTFTIQSCVNATIGTPSSANVAMFE